MGERPCIECVSVPMMKCGRCMATRCVRHALPPGERCDACEREWQDDVTTRRAAKLIFAPPVAILAGGMLFGLLLPVSIGGAIGASIMCAIACGTAVGAGTAMCRFVDRSARAMFMREKAGALPPARLLPSPKRH